MKVVISDGLVRCAIDAMFVPVVEAFPDIKTGDFSPEQEFALENAVREAIVGWVRNNSPLDDEEDDR